MPAIADVNAARHGVAITPGGGTFAETRAVYIGVAGDVTVKFADSGAPVVMKGASQGEHPWAIVQLTAAAATDIVALY